MRGDNFTDITLEISWMKGHVFTKGRVTRPPDLTRWLHCRAGTRTVNYLIQSPMTYPVDHDTSKSNDYYLYQCIAKRARGMKGANLIKNHNWIELIRFIALKNMQLESWNFPIYKVNVQHNKRYKYEWLKRTIINHAYWNKVLRYYIEIYIYYKY